MLFIKKLCNVVFKFIWVFIWHLIAAILSKKSYQKNGGRGLEKRYGGQDDHIGERVSMERGFKLLHAVLIFEE